MVLCHTCVGSGTSEGTLARSMLTVNGLSVDMPYAAPKYTRSNAPVTASKVCIFNVFLVMNPYLITAAIENLTPWKGEHGGDGDTSGYTGCMWQAVWGIPTREWTQTLAEELLRDAREYYDEVIAKVSGQNSQTGAFARWQRNFLNAMKNL